MVKRQTNKKESQNELKEQREEIDKLNRIDDKMKTAEEANQLQVTKIIYECKYTDYFKQESLKVSIFRNRNLENLQNGFSIYPNPRNNQTSEVH